MAKTTAALTPVFLMADLSGYTALTETHGDDHAARALRRYAVLARRALHPVSRLLERVGDEVLIVSDTVDAAIHTALALRAAVEREPLFPTIRAGLHMGPVARLGRRYAGAALNLTARVAAHARGGQILCTDAVRQGVSPAQSVAFVELGPVEFKNVGAPVVVFEVHGSDEPGGTRSIDPVCRMQLDIERAPARLPYRGVMYGFCSFECAQRFAQQPQRYVK